MEFKERHNQFLFDYIYEKTGVTRKQILSPLRKREVVDSRRLYMYVLRNYFGLTFMKIAQLTLHDHSTIVAGCKKFEYLSSVYPKLTTLPYKDICFNLDMMKDTVDGQVEDLKEQIILINQKIDKLLTIKQLQNGRRKKLHS